MARKPDEPRLGLEEKLHFPLTPEKLDFPTQERLQVLADRAMQIICMHLGIDLDDLEVFQDGLTHLNDQNVGRKDRLDSHKDMYRLIVKPQMEALTKLVQERLHIKDWQVKTSSSPMAGDMIHITITCLKEDLEIELYERGFQVNAPDFEVSWNIFPGEREEPITGRSKDTHITLLQKNNELGAPASIVKIQANPTVPADGVLQLIRTDSERTGGRPNLLTAAFPKKLTTQATYTRDGGLRYLRIHFPIPGTGGGIKNTLILAYDFRENPPKTGVLPTRSKRMSGEHIPELPINPQITVENDNLSLSYLEETDVFPVKTDGVIVIAEAAIRALKSHFPAKKPFLSLAQE